jgi:A/G-specific adenine glycosylase
MIASLPPAERRSLQEKLLGWFQISKRAFPWRETSDAYAVLIAEKLLQQTAARDIVVGVYNEFIDKFPTPRDLAQAEIADIERLIEPLGLLYRARELKAIAEVIVSRHEGKVPPSPSLLKELPGIGEYSARAVMAFAYDADVAIVDTNVARFLYRVHGLRGRIPPNPARTKSLIDLATTLLPLGRARDFNLAVLDLCAQICKPSNPICKSCPISSECEYGRLEVASVGRPAPDVGVE